MTEASFVLGNMCTVDKTSSRAQAGDTAVVTAVEGQAATSSATVFVFEERADAILASKHYIAFLAAPSAADNDILDASDLAALLAKARQKIEAVSKRSFNVSFATDYKHLFSNPRGTQREEDALIGKVVKVTSSIQYDSSQALVAGPLYSGNATVKHMHPTLPGIYVLKTDSTGQGAPAGEEHFVYLTKTLITELIGYEASTVDLPPAYHRKLAYKLIKALPSSQHVTGLDIKEFLDVVRAANVDSDVRHDSPGISFIVPLLFEKLQDMLDRNQGSETRTWPSSEPQRLGEAIKRWAATINVDPQQPQPQAQLPAPPQFPLCAALEKAVKTQTASAADAEDGLKAARAYVADSATHSVQRTHILNDSYVAQGAMEGFMRKSGQSEQSIDNADLATVSKIKFFFFQLSDGNTASSSSVTTHTSNPVINVLSHVDSSDEEETRLRTVLRADAVAVLADSAAMVRLSKLKGLTEQSDAELLRAAVNNEPMASLHRLVTSGEPVHKSLSGKLLSYLNSHTTWCLLIQNMGA